MKFTKIFFLLFCLTLWHSGTIIAAPEAPEYVRTKNWKIEKIEGGSIMLSATSVFFNPNKAKAKLKVVDIDIWLGETKAGKVRKTDKKVKIRKNSAFEIPLKIEIEPETNSWGYLSGLFSALTFQDSVIKLKGIVKFTVLGIPVRIRLNEEEDINLRDLL